MDCSIIMECSMLTNQDLKELNESSTTEYQIVTSNNFLPPETIYILVELGKSLIFSAAYDLLKYELSKILKIASGKKNITNLNNSYKPTNGRKHLYLACFRPYFFSPNR